MPCDAAAMAAVSDELRAVVVGGRIQRIIQPSSLAVALSLYRDGREHWLLLSADASRARVNLSRDRLAKVSPAPSPFIMLLRKHLEGKRLVRTEQPPYERAVHMVCGSGDEQFRLVAEIMGKHSNVILVDASHRVLGALKIITERQSRVRVVLPGAAFRPMPLQARAELYPESGPRLDPFLERERFVTALRGAPAETPLREALLGLLPGCSPFLADQIALRAGRSSKEEIGSADLDAVSESAAGLYSLYQSREWEPCTFSNARGKLDVSPYPPWGVTNVQREASISEAIERSLGGQENRDVLSVQRASLLSDIERRREGLERKLASLRTGLLSSEAAESAMERGQIILAYGFAAEPGADSLVVPDLDMTIPLDPRLSTSENAERQFRRYRKLRDARARLPGLISETERDVERLGDLAAFARMATNERELRALGQEQRGEQTEQAGTKGRSAPRGPAQFVFDGHTALVGRSAVENDLVTFRLARRGDLWLHARERTGAHVVLRSEGSRPPENLIEAAARLAAYFSEGRNDSGVDVDIADVRNVRKIPGGPPGRVTYRDHRTVHVDPGVDGWIESRPPKR